MVSDRFLRGLFLWRWFPPLGSTMERGFSSPDLVIPRRIHQTQAEAESWTFNLHHCQQNNPVRKSDEPVMTSNRRSEILRDLQKFCAVPSDAIVPIKSDIVPIPPSPTMPLHRIRFNIWGKPRSPWGAARELIIGTVINSSPFHAYPTTNIRLYPAHPIHAWYHQKNAKPPSCPYPITQFYFPSLISPPPLTKQPSTPTPDSPPET